MRKLADITKAEYTSPYQFEGRIPIRQAIPLGIQHVLAMFVGNITPLIIICARAAYPRRIRRYTWCSSRTPCSLQVSSPSYSSIP